MTTTSRAVCGNRISMSGLAPPWLPRTCSSKARARRAPRQRNCPSTLQVGHEGNTRCGVIFSPRKFIEIVLCFAVAAVVLCCLTLVLIVLAIFAAIESVVDRFKVWRVRR